MVSDSSIRVFLGKCSIRVTVLLEHLIHAFSIFSSFL